MSSWQLSLKQAPALRLDLRGITPAALAGLSTAQVEALPLGYGNRTLALAEFFSVAALPDAADDRLVLSGNLSRVDRIGWLLDAGRIHVEGSAGHHVGGCMSGGSVHVDGDAGLLAGCEMAGGLLSIGGNVDAHAAAALPGSMDGMRGGTLVVRGHAGARFGDRMRRGSAIVFGDAGDFLASRMVAGTIAVGGAVGQHPAYGMRRGSLVLASARADALPPTFVPSHADVGVFWQLLARDLARHGGPFEALPSRRIERHLGDLAAAGKGELIFPR